MNLGLLVGTDCLDKPQPQYKTPILPPDPIPRINPRPSPNTTPVPVTVGAPLPTSPENLGFTVYTLGLVAAIPGSSGPAPPPVTPPSLDFSRAENSQNIGLVFG